MKLIVNQVRDVRGNLLQETVDEIVRQAEGAHQYAAFDGIKQTNDRRVAGQLPAALEIPQTLVDGQERGREQVFVDLSDDGILSVAGLDEQAAHGGTVRTQVLPQAEIRLVDEDLPGGVPTGTRAGHQSGEGGMQQRVAVVPARVQAGLTDPGFGGNLRQIETSPAGFPIQIKGSTIHAFLQLRIARPAHFDGMRTGKTRHCAHSFREGVTWSHSKRPASNPAGPESPITTNSTNVQKGQMMSIIVAYKYAANPQDTTVDASGVVDWSRAKAAISEYDPVAVQVGRTLADSLGTDVVGISVGGKAVSSSMAKKGALSRGMDRALVVADDVTADWNATTVKSSTANIF